MGNYQFPMPEEHKANGTVGPPAAAEAANLPLKANSADDDVPAGYLSQSTAIWNRVRAQGVSTSELSSITKEKSKIAEDRFSSESSDWRKWYAESLVWGYFCKSSPLRFIDPQGIC